MLHPQQPSSCPQQPGPPLGTLSQLFPQPGLLCFFFNRCFLLIILACIRPIATIKSYNTLRGLKQHKCIVLHFCKLEIWQALLAKIWVTVGLSSLAEVLRENEFPSFFAASRALPPNSWTDGLLFLALKPVTFYFSDTKRARKVLWYKDASG